MSTESKTTTTLSKIETRMWSILISVALAFGGIWVQNQYNTTLKVQEQLAEYIRFADDKFVEQNSYDNREKVLDQRLDRIENKLDNLLDREYDRGVNGTNPSAGTSSR